VVNFSADIRYSFWSDQFCPSADQIANGITPEPFCMMYTDTQNFFELGGRDPSGRRFNGSRFYAGLTVVAAIDRRLSAFARMDFLPLAGILVFPRARMAYLDKYDSFMFEHDPQYYGTAGISLKF